MSVPGSNAVPSSCAVAFKEWEGVCEALASGRQSLILRKGGIAEGPGGFRPEYPAFWLYPTRVHQAEQGLKPGAAETGPEPSPGTVVLRSLAVVELVARVEGLEVLERLDDLHVWAAETVAARFHYRRPGLWVLGVRVWNLPSPWPLPVTPGQLGCKTWVPLESAPATAGLASALPEGEASRQIAEVRDRLLAAARSEPG